MWCVGRVPSHSGFTPGVSIEPSPVCGSGVSVNKEESWELLYADDTCILAEKEEELQRKVVEWQEALRRKHIPLAVDIYFAGGNFRANSKFAYKANISSTQKIRVIQ